MRAPEHFVLSRSECELLSLHILSFDPPLGFKFPKLPRERINCWRTITFVFAPMGRGRRAQAGLRLYDDMTSGSDSPFVPVDLLRKNAQLNTMFFNTGTGVRTLTGWPILTKRRVTRNRSHTTAK